MATILISCPEHGNFEITHKDLSVLIISNQDNPSYPTDHELLQYRVMCRIDKEHLHTINKNTEPRTVDLLAASGCEIEFIDLPQDSISVQPTKLNDDTLCNEVIDLQLQPDALLDKFYGQQ